MMHLKYKTLLMIFLGIFIFIGIGITIPKLTVDDTVPVSAQLKRCTDTAKEFFDNPFERIALMLGKGRIIATQGPSEAIMAFYTIFRIPLGVLRGQPDMKLVIACNMIDPDDWSAGVKE